MHRSSGNVFISVFQHTAARRRLANQLPADESHWMFQHTAARRRLVPATFCPRRRPAVSTHSRPKAAGPPPSPSYRHPAFQHTAARRRLGQGFERRRCLMQFQHTAARRRLVDERKFKAHRLTVSTHSRPKAAGASLKSLAPSGFAAPISLGSQEKREREYNTAFSVTPAFTIS